MRWLFIGLVIINVFYFIWSQQDFSGEPQLSAAKQQITAGTEQVKLLSEVVPEDDSRVLSAAESIAPAEELLLGGFSDEVTAVRLQQRLLSLDIESVVVALDSQVDIEYWVYLQPLPSRQASIRQLKELQARRIDSFLITQGDLANGISLGMFNREDSAQAVVGRLSAAGYKPLIRPVERLQRLYWVVIDVSARRLVDEKLLRQLVTDFVDMQHLLRPYSANER